MAEKIFSRKAQRQYFDELWAKMYGHFLAFYDSQQAADIHQFRVSVKKIRALLQHLQGDKKYRKSKKQRAQLREIYQHAGQMRTIHVQLGLMEEADIENESLRKEMRNQLSDFTGLFYRHQESYEKQLRKAEKVFRHHFEDRSLKQLRKQFKKMLSQPDDYFSAEQPDPEGLHECRKQIKHLLYLRQALPDQLKKHLHIDANYLDSLQEAIGDWHDTISLMEFLQNAGPEHAQKLETLEAKKTAQEAAIFERGKYFLLKAVEDHWKKKEKIQGKI